jgi:hypothetical protein
VYGFPAVSDKLAPAENRPTRRVLARFTAMPNMYNYHRKIALHILAI